MKYKDVLLIDDDEDDQEILLTAVTQISPSINCIAKSSAAEALSKLRTKELSTDVIFLDLNMPVMEGKEFLTKVKEEPLLADIPVIIFSTSSDPDTIKLMKDLGASDFITKPSGFDSLVELLHPLVV